MILSDHCKYLDRGVDKPLTLWYSHCVIIMAAAVKHFEIPANTERSVRAKCKHCTQVMTGSTKVTSNFVKHLKVRISSLSTCHFYCIAILGDNIVFQRNIYIS